MVVIRFLFALLLGFLLGAGTTIWLVQSGTGDFMIKRTEVVQDLERKVRDLEQQRDSLTRTLRGRHGAHRAHGERVQRTRAPLQEPVGRPGASAATGATW